MARKAKSTVSVKLSDDTKIEITPKVNFQIEDMSEEQVLKLAQTALKAKVAYVVTKAVKEIAPAIQTNLSLKEEMLKAFPAKAVEAFFQTKATEFPASIEVNIGDIFKVEEDDETEE